MKKFLFAIILSAVLQPLIAQEPVAKSDSIYRFAPKQLVLPVVLVGAGAAGSLADDIQEFDFGLCGPDRGKVHEGFVADDILQYIPAAGFYALKLSGVRSVHNYGDATVILALSYGMASVATLACKEIAGVQRPNGADNRSFTSGHSAIAFMGAEFLRKEYGAAYPWIGAAGYAVAAGTALARVAHNEHWITDVVAGAGIGILATRTAYWIYPWVERNIVRKVVPKNGNLSFVGIPYCSSEGAGIALALNF